MKFLFLSRVRILIFLILPVVILYSCERPERTKRKESIKIAATQSPSPTMGPAPVVRGDSSPRLILGIIVDQMRYDFLPRYWNRFGDGGFRKLVKGGYSFNNTKYNFAPTKTCPTHTSIYTGATPSVHGIIGNSWFDRSLGNKGDEMYCAYDGAVFPVGIEKGRDSDDSTGRRSPGNMLVTTVTDEFRLATNMESVVIGISLKDRGAIMPAGHLGNAAYWLDDNTGTWITSSYYYRAEGNRDKRTLQLPGWVRTFNEKYSAEKYLKQPGIDGKWKTLLDKSKYSASDEGNEKYEKSIRGKDEGGNYRPPVLPYDLVEVLTENEKEFRGKWGRLIKHTPYGNSITADFAIAALRDDELALGRDEITDFMAVSFSATDIIGHSYGPRSMEIEDAYIRLDRDIAGILDEIDERVGEGNYLVFLTSDHGAVDVPLYLQDEGIPAGYFMDDDDVKDNLNRYLKEKFDLGDTDAVLSYSNQQVYLDRKAIAKDSRLNIVEVESEVVRYMMALDGVADAVTASDLNKAEFSRGRKLMVQNGFNRKRSGDVAIIMEPSWIEYKKRFDKKGTTHGAPYNYDTHVPLVFYGWKIKEGESVRPVEITDIAPTISALLKIPFPNGATGNPLVELFD
ncbi:MAG: alkaline phosphatase family protein [Deltaproteobacteria bacterium]